MNGEEPWEVVADTNVVSYLISTKPEVVSLAHRYLPHLNGRPVAISFQTRAELLVGMETQGWNHRRFSDLIGRFEVIPWSERLLDCYVRIRSASVERRRRTGEKRITAADAWIAATALLLERPLVTHDGALSRSPLIETITELDA